ncbi:MAG: hypothetical protein J6Y48_17600, partial [Clostridia bacterium]|nr:hypothetical protein [Clostridia bacterium]
GEQQPQIYVDENGNYFTYGPDGQKVNLSPDQVPDPSAALPSKGGQGTKPPNANTNMSRKYSRGGWRI